MTSLKRNIVITLFLVISQMLITMHAQSLYTPFPTGFHNTQNNELSNVSALRSVFNKIKSGKAVKVMHIGDSHVRGGYLPKSVQATLTKYFPKIQFSYYGINGAWARRFYEKDMIQKVSSEHPDIVIISFGTNEATSSSIDVNAHAETMALLTSRISQRCPNVTFLFTTPPGSYISKRTGTYTTTRRRKARTRYTTSKVPNAENTAKVAQSIVTFCNNNHFAVWDLFTISGGQASACTNWRNSNMMQVDLIHFNVYGYNLQGKMLGEAVHKAYIGTPASGTQTRLAHGSTPLEQKPYSSVIGL